MRIPRPKKNHVLPQRGEALDANKQGFRVTTKHTNRRTATTSTNRERERERGRSGRIGWGRGVSSSIRAYLRSRLPLLFDCSRPNGQKKTQPCMYAQKPEVIILYYTQDASIPLSFQHSRRDFNASSATPVKFMITLFAGARIILILIFLVLSKFPNIRNYALKYRK